MSFFVAGGTVPPGSPSYVERSADRELFEALLAGEYCYVLNSRQMGKSSLAVRTVTRLNEAGVFTAFVDLTRLGSSTVTPEQWYAGLLAEAGRALGLRQEAANTLRESRDLGSAQRFLGFLHDAVRLWKKGPIVLMIDEIDAVRSLPFSTDELFAGIRQLHNGRASDPELARLTFCLLGAALPSDLIRDPRMTPFNVGRRIDLKDFTEAEIQPFAAVIGDASLSRLLYWTAGHPFLTQSLGEALTQGKSVDALVRSRYLDARAREADTNLADVANRLLGKGDPDTNEALRADVLSLYESMLRGKPVTDDEANQAAARIKMSGVARVEGGRLKVRNRIYQSAFDREWIRANMPGQELRRQRRAFWKGVLRTGAVVGTVTAVIAGLAVAYARAASEARRERDRTAALNERLDLQLYLARASLMRQAWESSRMDELRTLLQQTERSPHRGWEWDYWHRLAYAEIGRLPIENPVGLAPSENRRWAIARNREGRLWLTDGKRTSPLPSGVRLQFASPDNRREFVLGLDEKNRPTVVDARTGKSLWHGTPAREIRNLSFSADGLRVLLGSGQWLVQGAVKVWDWRANRLLLDFSHPSTAFRDSSFSADGKRILTSTQNWNGNDYATELVDIATKRALRRFPTSGTTWSCAFSGDEKQVLAGEWGHRVTVWDTATGAMRDVWETRSTVYAIGRSPDGRNAALMQSREVSVVDSSGHQLFSVPGAYGAWIDSWGHVHTGRPAGGGSELTTFDLVRSAPSISIQRLGSTQTPLAIGPDGRNIYYASDAGTLTIIDPRRAKPVRVLPGSGQQVTVSQGKYFASAEVAAAGKVYLTDQETGKRTDFSPEARCWQLGLCGVLQLDPSGETLLTTDRDGFAALFSVPGGEKRAVLGRKDGKPSMAALSEDGKTAFVGTAYGGLRSFSVADAEPRGRWKIEKGQIFSMDVSEDGGRLALGYADGHIDVLDLASGRSVCRFAAFGGGATSVRFNKAGDRLLIAGDSQAKLIHIPSGVEVLRLDGENAIISAIFTKDEKAIVTSGWDDLRVWSRRMLSAEEVPK